MRKIVNFFVPGIPATSGSKRAFYNKATGRVSMVPDNKRQKPWQATVRLAASEAYKSAPFTGPVFLSCQICFTRPKGHFGTGKNAAKVKEGAPKYHTSKPDSLKVCRAIEDALSGVIWKDDSQITCHFIEKSYADKPGASILVCSLGKEDL
jgi:Holliday junction resolvase RusA-like endonuclease